MPTRAPSVCACGHSVPSGATCACRAQRKAEHDARRPSSSARGYDHAFHQLTAGFLDAHPRCACGAKAVAVGHIASIRARPDLRLDPANLKPICRACNRREAHAEAKTGGWSPISDPRGPNRRGCFPRTSAESRFPVFA